jgi:hypothetical protein
MRSRVWFFGELLFVFAVVACILGGCGLFGYWVAYRSPIAPKATALCPSGEHLESELIDGRKFWYCSGPITRRSK